MCVRIVKMQDVDLAQVQFDYDLTWAALFLNSDGNVYARYGARGEEGPMEMNSVAGLRATLRKVLEIHRGYPQNKDLLRDKRGPKPRFERPELFPVKEMRDLAKADPSRSKNCIHCHMVHEAQSRVAVNEGTYKPKDYFRYPPPDSVGLTLDKTDATRIAAVRKGSIAATAGLKKADEILVLDGQLLASIADLVFVLHHARVGDLKGEVLRQGKRQGFTLKLRKGWRPTNLGWRGSMWKMPPWPRLWVEELPEGQRKKLKIPDDRLALLVKLAWGPQVSRAGIRKHDVLVGYDGRRKRCTPGEFHTYVRLNCYRPKSRLKLTVLRRGREKDIAVRF